MDAWAWTKEVGRLLSEMEGAKCLLLVGTGYRTMAEEIAAEHQLTLAELNGNIRPGAFIVTTDKEARGGSIDG